MTAISMSAWRPQGYIPAFAGAASERRRRILIQTLICTCKERWIALQATPQYQEATAQRYRVEQAFGPAKQKHGFDRCRYIGLLRSRIQSLFTFLVRNFKSKMRLRRRMVKLLTGLTFRPQAKGRRAEVIRSVYACLPWV